MTQQERIVQYLTEHDRITPWDAWSQLGITKLSTRIGEIERTTDHRFVRQRITTKNRFNENVTFMSYSLEQNNDKG